MAQRGAGLGWCWMAGVAANDEHSHGARFLGRPVGLLLINWQIDLKGSSGTNTAWGNKIQVWKW